jgi:hypothetical protein
MQLPVPVTMIPILAGIDIPETGKEIDIFFTKK